MLSLPGALMMRSGYDKGILERRSCGFNGGWRGRYLGRKGNWEGKRKGKEKEKKDWRVAQGEPSDSGVSGRMGERVRGLGGCRVPWRGWISTIQAKQRRAEMKPNPTVYRGETMNQG